MNEPTQNNRLRTLIRRVLYIATPILSLILALRSIGDPRDEPITFRYCYLGIPKHLKNDDSVDLVCKYPDTGYYAFQLLPQGQKVPSNGRVESIWEYRPAQLDIHEGAEKTYVTPMPDGRLWIKRVDGELWATFDIDVMRFTISTSPVPIIAFPN